MPADDEKSPLILEFEEFQHKLHAAIRVTYFAFQEESKQILDVAFFPYAYMGQTSKRPANTDEIMWVKDAEDPQRWEPIEGRKITQRSSPKSKAQAAARAEARVENKRLMISSGLYYYLDVLLERMIPLVRQNFRDVAALARRYSSSDQLVLEAHLAPIEITASLTKNPDSLGFLCEFWGHPEYAAAFKERFRVVFVKEFERLRSEAELQGPAQSSTQTQDGRREAALASARASESAGDLDTDESAEERWRRTQQIGDRVVSRKSPQRSAIGSRAPRRRRSRRRSPRKVDPVEITKPAATPGPAADPPAPKIPELRTPVQGEEVRQPPASLIERIRSSKKKPLYVAIEMFKAEHPGESDTNVILKGVDEMITVIKKRSEAEHKQVRKEVHDSVPGRWQERIGIKTALVAYWDDSRGKERGRIKSYVSGVKTIR